MKKCIVFLFFLMSSFSMSHASPRLFSELYQQYKYYKIYMNAHDGDTLDIVTESVGFDLLLNTRMYMCYVDSAMDYCFILGLLKEDDIQVENRTIYDAVGKYLEKNYSTFIEYEGSLAISIVIIAILYEYNGNVEKYLSYFNIAE